MCIASRKRNSGRLRQKATRRDILSSDNPAKKRFERENTPIPPVISVLFRNRRGVFLASAGGHGYSGFQPGGGK